MRNIALNNTQFRYVYLNDIDFMPYADLYTMIRRTIQCGALPLNNVSESEIASVLYLHALNSKVIN